MTLTQELLGTFGLIQIYTVAVESQLSHPDCKISMILKCIYPLDFLLSHISQCESAVPHRRDLPLCNWTSQPGQDGPAGRGWGPAAGRRATGAGLDGHHLLLDEPALGAAEKHPCRPGERGAAAGPLRTCRGTEPGAVGSGAPATLVLQ